MFLDFLQIVLSATDRFRTYVSSVQNAFSHHAENAHWRRSEKEGISRRAYEILPQNALSCQCEDSFPRKSLIAVSRQRGNPEMEVSL